MARRTPLMPSRCNPLPVVRTLDDLLSACTFDENSGCLNYPKRGKSRLSWTFFKGEIPRGLWVLHRCDNGFCVRPDHLFLGTCADNVHDMMAKGRAKFGDHK